MSFFSQIHQFERSRLKKTDTSVRTCDGKQYIERLDTHSGKYSTSNTDRTSLGWVVDLEPDLQLAEACENVYIGSQDVVSDLVLLQGNGITHILNLAPGVENSFPEKFTYCSLPTLDVPETDMLSVFDKSNEFIENAMKSGGRVLVHCNAGVSRAPTVAAAYIMKTEMLKASVALERIRSVRQAASPNKGFIEQLSKYERFLINLQG